MTQDDAWVQKYNEVVAFIENNKRNPSRHRIDEHDMLNWVKHNRKVMNKGALKAERVERFNELLALIEGYKRKKQYE